MSNNAFIIFRNESDFAALSASPLPETNLPVTNLQLQENGYIMRSTVGVTTQYISGNLTADRTASTDGMALLGIYSSTATVRVQLYSLTDNLGSLVYDSTELPVSPDGQEFYNVFDSAVGTYRSFRIIFTDTNPPNNVIELSRLMVGTVFRPNITISYGLSYLIEDDTTQERDAGGGLHSSPQARYKTFSFSFEFLDETERDALHDAIDWVGKTRDFYIALKPFLPESRKYDYAALCKFTSIPNIQQDYFEEHSASFECSETFGGYSVPISAAPTPPPVVNPPAGEGNEGTDTGYWTASLLGYVGTSERARVAYDGVDTIIAVYGTGIVSRSTDKGLTFTTFSIAGYQFTDVCWTGIHFAACDTAGNIYYSSTLGSTWNVVADGVGFRLDKIVGVNNFIIAAGEKVYGYAVDTLTFGDFTSSPAGWVETSCAGVLYYALSNYIFLMSGDDTRLYRYTLSTGAMTNFIPNGITGKYVVSMYAFEHIAVLMDDGKLYISNDAGANFTFLAAPPTNYQIYDVLLTTRPELLVVADPINGDTRQRRILGWMNSKFMELAVKLTYAGRQMLVQEGSRLMSYTIDPAQSSGTVNIGANITYLTSVEFYSAGIKASIPYTYSGGVLTWTATPDFQGEILILVNNQSFS